MSGIWFDVDLVGGVFKKIANALPFIHAVELNGLSLVRIIRVSCRTFGWVLGYTIVAVAGAVLLFFAADEKKIIVADKGGRYNDNKIILQCNHKICAWNYSCRGLLLFLPAGTVQYPNGWLLMGVLFVPMFVAGIVMMFKNPQLLSKRLNAKEQQSEQSLVIKLSGLMFVVWLCIGRA